MPATATVRVQEGSYRDDWCTPTWLLNLVRLVGPIGLDPCSNERSKVGATTEWDIKRAEDGQNLPWGGHGLVWCNPPFGRAMPDWSWKMALEGSRGVEVLAIVPANVSSRWFHRDISSADLLLWWRRRVSFVDHDGVEQRGNTQDMVSPYWGPRVRHVKDVFLRHCWWVEQA